MPLGSTQTLPHTPFIFTPCLLNEVGVSCVSGCRRSSLCNVDDEHWTRSGSLGEPKGSSSNGTTLSLIRLNSGLILSCICPLSESLTSPVIKMGKVVTNKSPKLLWSKKDQLGCIFFFDDKIWRDNSLLEYFSVYQKSRKLESMFTWCHQILKVPMTLNFSPPFYSRKSKSMLH